MKGMEAMAESRTFRHGNVQTWMGTLLGFVLFLGFAPQAWAEGEDEDPAIHRALLKSRQTEAMYRFQTLLETLDSASTNIKGSDPKASVRLAKAAARLREHQLMGRMDEILS